MDVTASNLSASTDLETLTAFISDLKNSHPPVLSVAAIGTKDKLPFQFLTAREGLFLRVTELAEEACGALARNKIVTASTLVRSLLETVAVVWKLNEVLKNQEMKSDNDVRSDVLKILQGSKLDDAEFPAFNVMTILEKMNVVFPKIYDNWKKLCEYAHPNALGTTAAYCTFNPENFTVTFGQNMNHAKYSRMAALNTIGFCLEVFTAAYNDMPDRLQKLIDRLPKFEVPD